MSVFIIAEAGVNHNGDLQKAVEMVDLAAAAGADAVKFQTFKAEKLASKYAPKADYQKVLTSSTESQVAMLKKLELSEEQHLVVRDYCDRKGIEFMSTAFDFDSLEFLTAKMSLKRLKIPSGEITNLPLILEHARHGLDIILSTGMAQVSEIEQALNVIAAGYSLNGVQSEVYRDWSQYLPTESDRTVLKEKVTILHCTSEYPAPPEVLNLKALQSLSTMFGCSVGYSDHSLGEWASVSAVALGASVIEKHFTLDKSLPGPDHKASLDPDQLFSFVDSIRKTEEALGDGVRRPSLQEIANRQPIRKSLVVQKELHAGEVIMPQHIALLRPEGGLAPKYYWRLIGSKALRNYAPGECFEELLASAAED